MRTLIVLACAALVSGLHGQSVRLPGPLALVINSPNVPVWGAADQGGRYQSIYAGSSLSYLGIPLQILRLRWFGSLLNYAGPGGTLTQATIKLGHSGRPWNALSTVFGLNQGPDVTTVYSGTVSLLPIPANTSGQVLVDVTLTSPFVFFPEYGDLLVELSWDAGHFTGTTRNSGFGVGTAGTIWEVGYSNSNSASYLPAVGAPPLELVYVPAAAAYANTFGTGCYLHRATCFEQGALPAVTTGPGSLRAVPNAGGGYDVGPGTGSWQAPPVIGPSVPTTTVQLGFTFPYSGGGTGSVVMSEYGYVWLNGAGQDTYYCSSDELVRRPARIAVLWGNNVNGVPITNYPYFQQVGNLCYHRDTATGGGVLTWLNMANLVYSGGSSYTPCTFQLALEPGGAFEMRWGPCQINSNVLIGWSPGNGALQPASQDLAATMPFATHVDVVPPTLRAVTRPLLGSSVPMETTSLPPGSLFGGVFVSLSGHPAGLPLDPFGMTGCLQYAGFDSMLPFLPAGTSATASLALPNATFWIGTMGYAQSLVLAPGGNAAGVQASNGLRLLLDNH